MRAETKPFKPMTTRAQGTSWAAAMATRWPAADDVLALWNQNWGR